MNLGVSKCSVTAVGTGHFAVFMNSSEFLKELGALLAITVR
jgi:hypothetical protein